MINFCRCIFSHNSLHEADNPRFFPPLRRSDTLSKVELPLGDRGEPAEFKFQPNLCERGLMRTRGIISVIGHAQVNWEVVELQEELSRAMSAKGVKGGGKHGGRSHPDSVANKLTNSGVMPSGNSFKGHAR